MVFNKGKHRDVKQHALGFRALGDAGLRVGFAAKLREQDDIANGMRVGKKHGKAVDANAFAGGRWHTMAQGANVVDVELLRNFISSLGDLREEATFLFRWIVKFGEAIGDLHASNKNLEALGERRIVGLLLGERRNVGREVVENGGLDEFGFGHGFKEQASPFSVRELTLRSCVLGMVGFGPFIVTGGDLFRPAGRGKFLKCWRRRGAFRPILDKSLAHGETLHMTEVEFVVTVLHNG